MTSLIEKIAKIRETNPGNRAMKFFNAKFYEGLSDTDKVEFERCIRSGVENPDSSVGCYAMTPKDYERFSAFFNQVIGHYHKNDAKCKLVHKSSWAIPENMGKNGVLDLREQGIKDPMSMRVRVGRNLEGFNLPGAMTKDERIKFEQTMLEVFAELGAKHGMPGKVYSLTPDFGEGKKNPNLISAEKYKELVAAHIMFKDMSQDPFLVTAGLASDWPYGRGCWQSDDKELMIWMGEEDQLRIMCIKTGFVLNEVFDNLRKLLDAVESVESVKFAHSDRYGYLTTCPTNLGTGMRASVHIKVPRLTADSTDKKVKIVTNPIGLSVRGKGGEHTPIGKDGTVDISPQSRLFISEGQILEKLYKGVKSLLIAENNANVVQVGFHRNKSTAYGDRVKAVLHDGEKEVKVTGLGPAISDAVEVVEQLKQDDMVKMISINTSRGEDETARRRQSDKISMTVVKTAGFDAKYAVELKDLAEKKAAAAVAAEERKAARAVAAAEKKAARAAVLEERKKVAEEKKKAEEEEKKE